MSEAWLEELPLDECLVLLRGNAIGRIASVTDDQLTVLPVNYRLVEAAGTTPGRWLALRTRPGNVIERASMMVAFEIDGIDASHQQEWSVLLRGTLHHVDSDAASFRERFDSVPWLVAERDAWLIIDPFTITGRRLHPGRRSNNTGAAAESSKLLAGKNFVLVTKRPKSSAPRTPASRTVSHMASRSG